MNFDEKSVQNEFNDLLQYIDNDIEHKKCLWKNNEQQNRYSDIKPYYFNAIVLSGDRYINASYISIRERNYFISTQGPKDNTIDDFYSMIQQHKSEYIIMLCKEMEQKRIKCSNYWEPNKVKNISNEFNIQIHSMNNDNNFIKREIILQNKKDNTSIGFTQIQYTSWPDHGVPNSDSFQCFYGLIKYLVSNKKEGYPLIVHCSAGVGRTGTFIAMYILTLEIAEQINRNVEPIQFNILNLVRKLKEMRLYLVQTVSQYQFIYEYAQYLLKTYQVNDIKI